MKFILCFSDHLNGNFWKEKEDIKTIFNFFKHMIKIGNFRWIISQFNHSIIEFKFSNLRQFNLIRINSQHLWSWKFHELRNTRMKFTKFKYNR